ncbi:sugar phosphate isomerase/epimerase family protein [Actinomadura rugatobispora]|uniref:Sugar phosphate isomerase/epimerase family protein n=1 Tax=Actinomadura rugatobispora TaxID=1994 RepID=A0ABW0ZZ95_9ACTN|nr:sugar phosphate isomerase/epimerase [Actinomadura rugatobispora]
MTGGLVEHLTFMNGCAARVPFRALLPAVAAAGFDAISLWPNVWRHALRRDGLTLAAMRSMLDDHGLGVADCDSCRDWIPGPDGAALALPGPAADRREIFEVCAALGAGTVVAVHHGSGGLVLDRDAAAFAALCDDAAEHGLRVALEFIPFTPVPDVATAWSLIDAAGRPNGGMVFDVWHHVRSGAHDGLPDTVPAARIFTVQLADGPLEPPGPDLEEEARSGRLPPGAGQMGLARLLRILRERGVRAAVGPELALPTHARPLEALIAEVAAATRSVLAAAEVKTRPAV